MWYFSYLQDKEAIKELFGAVAEKVGGRPGGYTRIIKLGARVGDNAETAMIELVDFNEIYGKGIGEDKTAAKKTRRAGSRKRLKKLLKKQKKHQQLKSQQQNNYKNYFITCPSVSGGHFFCRKVNFGIRKSY